MLQNPKIMTTLTTPRRVIIFGGSNAKRIVPFLLKLTKGKGIRIEYRTVSGHSLKDLENLLWIPIRNCLYQKFIYVSILKPRR